MPRGIYKHKPLSQETKIKISFAQKERFKNIINHPMYGKHHSEEAKRKIGLIQKGKKLSQKTKEAISKGMMGKKNSLGKLHSEEHKKKLSLSALRWGLGKITSHSKGKDHYLWKGDKVGYRGMHSWIINNFGKANHCENYLIHKSTRYHWANKSGRYLRNISDYKQLCPSCHYNWDRSKRLEQQKENA